MTYDGTSHTIEVLPGDGATEYDSITYTVGGEAFDGATEPGEYEITVTLKKDGYYDWTDTATLTINKASGTQEPGYVVPTPDAIEYEEGKTLADIELPEGWAWAEPTTPVEEGTQTYPANYTPTDDDHYTAVNDVLVTVTATAPGVITGYTFTDEDVTYDGTSHNIEVVAGDDAIPYDSVTYVREGAEFDGATEPGTYVITVTLKKDGYNDWTRTATLTINKASGTEEPGYEVPSINAPEEYAEGKTLADFPLPEGSGWAWADPATPVEEGTHTYPANYTPTDDDHYTAVEGVPVTVTVTSPVPIAGYSLQQDAEFKYDGTPKSLDVVVADDATAGAAIGAPSFEKLNETTGDWEPLPAGEPVEIGTYKQTVTITKGGVEDVVLTAEFEIAPGEIKGYLFPEDGFSFKPDGKSKNITEDAIVKTNDATEGVTIGAFEYFDSKGNPIDAKDVTKIGTYKVKTTLTKDNYEPKTLETTITIKDTGSGGSGGAVLASKQSVTLDNGDGTTKVVSVTKGKALEEKDATPKEREGYTFSGWFEDPDFTEPYDFSKPVDKDITLYAKYEEEKVDEGFTDIDGHWAEEFIDDAVEKGIFAGYGDGTFRPDLGITRQEIAVAMIRLLGMEDDIDSADLSIIEDFSDEGTIAEWAKKYVALAVENKVFEGYAEGYFAPERIISREELCAVLTRTAGEALDREADFSDVGTTTNKWASPYIAPMAEAGIALGYPDGTFLGKNKITRAEAATMLSKFAAKFLSK